MTKTVVIDSDAIYAIYNPKDPLHERSIQTLQWLDNEHFQIIYPTSVIFEVMSLFQRVLSTPSVTTKLIDMVSKDLLILHIIDSELIKETASIFKPAGSKKNTFVDCSVVAVAKKIKANGVFAYDSFYTKKGLKLAEDVIKINARD